MGANVPITTSATTKNPVTLTVPSTSELPAGTRVIAGIDTRPQPLRDVGRHPATKISVMRPNESLLAREVASLRGQRQAAATCTHLLGRERGHVGGSHLRTVTGPGGSHVRHSGESLRGPRLAFAMLPWYTSRLEPAVCAQGVLALPMSSIRRLRVRMWYPHTGNSNIG